MEYCIWRKIFTEQVYQDFRKFVKANVDVGFFNNESLRDLDIKFQYMELRDQGIKRNKSIEILAERYFTSTKTVERVLTIYKDQDKDGEVKGLTELVEGGE